MASYIASVAVDTTGNGPVPTTSAYDQTVSDPLTLIRILANQGHSDAYYGEIKGTFTYDGAPNFLLNGGTVDTIIIYKGSPPGPDEVLESYEARDTPVDIMVWLGLTGAEANAYLYRMNDAIVGSPFDDMLEAFAGNDYVEAGDGNDKVWGDAGKDLLSGDAGNDKIWGGSGKDVIFGGTGNDKMWGNGGHDTFGFHPNEGKDHLKDFNKKKDFLVFDTDMVRNQNKLEKLADEKGSNVVIDFGGGNMVIIHDFSLSDLHKSTISFFDYDL
jgi:Ca2+-binding RTX toxin-like protein